jgi:hypothetical protein
MNAKLGLSTGLVILIVLAAVVAGAFAYRLLISPNTRETHSICESCFVNTPVGDIIIPQIAVGSSGKSNAQLNLTLGEELNLTVEVFLSINASVAMSFNVRLSPGFASTDSDSAFSVSFSPSSFEAFANKNATTIMSIFTSRSAQEGLYSTEVVVTDLQNSNYTWGTQIEIQVK